ncbi:SRPBCC family protein [Rhizobium sp. XQZ8]|uniref:SRPBCC family protein n=1 Tax=Rhizobium populisoli TaxID=2859785 RepID=UPI001CA5C2FE|nr:SRPBCC family protein [Rhizobium populisoli]MBW6424673.1 SRPBCC family protein [Rhizobium populisoli]
MTILPARIIHIGIDRPWREVYAYAADPENLQHWASGLASGLERDGEDWVGDGGPIGKIRVRFVPENPFGILDHTVTMKNGLVVENPIRIMANGDGAEITFLLLKRPDMSDAAFESDAAHVLKDLTTLKNLLEAGK